MVQVRYKGQNYISINGYKIVNGFNEIKDSDFYKMMDSKTFASRVRRGILEVPKGFPLERTSEIKEVEAKTNPVQSVSLEEGNLDVKSLIKAINKSDDMGYLQGFEGDERIKVAEAAKKRRESLESSEKK